MEPVEASTEWICQTWGPRGALLDLARDGRALGQSVPPRSGYCRHVAEEIAGAVRRRQETEPLHKIEPFGPRHDIGRDAVRERARKGVESRLVYLAVEAVDADAHGSEPVYADGRMVGLTTSGAYGYAVGQSIAFAYVEPDCAEPGSALEIAILGERRAARVLAEPLFDARNRRLRA